MFKGFKEFLLRGNIVDLAVAVVIGTAFTALVAAFTASFINPIIARAGGTSELGWGIQLGEKGDDTTFIDIGTFVGAIITFLITALVVYFFVVVPMKKVMERYSKPEEETAEAVSEEVVILREIRDSLARGEGTSHGGGSHL